MQCVIIASRLCRGSAPNKENDTVAKQGGIVITEPYKAKGNGHIVVTIAKQAEDKNGVVAIDLSLDNLLTTKLINIGKRDMLSF